MSIQNPTPDEVKAARIAAGFTQKQAGERFGLGERAWRHKELENGRKLSPGEYELLLLLAGAHPEYELIRKKI